MSRTIIAQGLAGLCCSDLLSSAMTLAGVVRCELQYGKATGGWKSIVVPPPSSERREFSLTFDTEDALGINWRWASGGGGFIESVSRKIAAENRAALVRCFCWC